VVTARRTATPAIPERQRIAVQLIRHDGSQLFS
jgi:hypothetical protein